MSQNEEQQLQSEGNPANEVPSLPPEEIQLIVNGVDTLHTKLSEDAALATEIEAVIQEHLRRNVTSDTFYKIINGLELYLDEDTVFFLLEAIRRSNEPSRIDAIKSQSSDPFWNWLRRLIALYAFDFRKAYTAATENPHAWDVLNRHTYYDSLSSAWIIAMEIIKYNGESLAIEETPAGAFTLLYGIVDMLRNVSAEDAPDLVNRGYLADLVAEFHQLIGLYAPGLLAEMAEEAEKGAS